ncbi:DEAD/DEAH box helicase [Halarchaeum salinum]|uniref:Helicase ATP-binding domain-containing protein n=1 Tax=Halarchaeum salinum TaxID=489912 RepID=A0AAV3SAW1_9EURY
MNIDDIADSHTNQASPGERFRDNWLDDLPQGQWPSYIDESAQLVADGIFIGDTDLTSGDFAFETGQYYRRGLSASADIDHRETSLPLGNYRASQIGKVAWTFNKLREELRTAKHTDFENSSRAIEAAINKALVERVERGDVAPEDLETIRLPDSATVSTLVSEVFCRPRSTEYVDILLDTVSESAADGLLNRIEEPRMVTPLWDHQRAALDEWLAHDCRGYVDMATATGKTFLGLAAIAHHFGTLHPNDRDLTDTRVQSSDDGRATVVIVAHRDLILDQWKREFDTHLNIPEQSTTNPGEHTAHFEWGDVHFWAPSRLKNADILDKAIDLVVLDETHHYLGSSGFGSLLDALNGDLLALSGSLDETNERTLERRDIPKLFEFTIQDGQRAGVIPQCDWDVVVTPYENQANLADVTERCRRGMERYANGVDVPDAIDGETNTVRIENLSDARSLAQSTIGRELKEQDEAFREFASAVMARQLTRYNLSPDLSTVVHLVLDNVDQHKCVVLLETDEEIKHVASKLKGQLGDAYESLVTVFDDDTDLSAVEAFDQDQEHGAIIGVARTLGEGVDIETADVCINRGRGRLSRSLVQRMGRILRNPDGQKHAHFYHVAGIPTRDDALMADEDGVTFLETASQLLDWGEGFDARPVFDVDAEAGLNEHDLASLERSGADAIEDWYPDHYNYPSDDGVHDYLKTLISEIQEQDGSTLLAIERPTRDTGSEDVGVEEVDPIGEPLDEDVQFVAADGGGIELADWLYALVDAASDDTEQFVEEAVREYAQTTFAYPDEDAIPDADGVETISLNPALDALLTAYVEDGSKTATVHAAVGKLLSAENVASLTDTDQPLSDDEIEMKLTALVEHA